MDAIDEFVELFDNKEEFINKFIESTLFFPKDVVQKQNEALINLFRNNGKFPVRSSDTFKNQWPINYDSEAQKYSKNNEVSLKEYPDINVIVDKDGNYDVRKLIKKHFGHKVSVGKESTIKNYTISHVWGMSTHPLFFTSLWNIVLIPTHFNYLMDKKDDAHPIVKKVKSTIKQKCINLYSPYDSFLKHFEIEKKIKDEFKINSTNQNKFKFNFVSHIDSKVEEISTTDAEMEEINSVLKSAGKGFFVDYFEIFANGEDPAKNIPVGVYTYKSYHTKVSCMNRIFRDNHEVKALKIILDSTRLDEETLDKAQELLDLYK